MATKKSTYTTVFGAEDNLTPKMKKMEGSFDGFKKTAGGATSTVVSGFADIATAVVAVNAALAVSAVALLKYSSDGTRAIEDLGTALNIPAEKAEEFGAIAKSAYNELLVDSVSEGAKAVQTAFEILGDVGEEALGRSTNAALELQRLFDADLKQSIDASKTLMDNFGLTSDQAFDLISEGFKNGLNRGDDFLDTIGEYSTQFKEGGATAEEFFSLLDSGLQGGVLGTDKAADAFKEFRLRILDGSKDAGESLQALGIDADEFQRKLSSGSVTSAQAFELVIEKLKGIEDPTKRIQVATGLMGTQFEDLGDSAATALTLASDKFNDVEGSAKRLAKETFTASEAFEQAYRKILGTITDNEAFDAFESQVSEFLQSFGENFETAFANVDVSGLEDAVRELFSSIAENLSSVFDADIDFSSAEGIEATIQAIVNATESWISVMGDVVDVVGPVFAKVLKAVGDLNNASSGISETFRALGAGFEAVVNVVQSAGAGLLAIMTQGIEAFLAVAEIALFLPGKVLPGVEKFRDKIGALKDGIGEFKKELAADAAKNFKEGIESGGRAIDVFTGKAVVAKKAIEDIPDKKEIDIKGEIAIETQVDTTEVDKSARYIKDEFGNLKPKVNVEGGIDAESWKDTGEYIEQFYEVNGEQRSILVSVEPDEESIEKTEEELTKLQEIKLEIQAKLDVANIEAETARFESTTEATTERIQAFLEFRAEIEIAKAENDLKRFEAALEGTSSVISELSDSSASLFAAYDKDMDFLTLTRLRKQLDQNLAIQKEQAELQKQLIELEIERNRIRNELLRNNATKEIKVTMDERVNVVGKAFLKLLIEAVQAEVNLEGHEALIEAA